MTVALEPFAALGTTATVAVVDNSALHAAEVILRSELDRLDQTCSRFRTDSELTRLNDSAGTGPVAVSALLLDHIEAALRGSRLTGGRLDPTVGAAIEIVGYDRDFPLVPTDGPALSVTVRAVPGWRRVVVDRRHGTVSLPRGTKLDLGATAKALQADRAAVLIAASTGSPTLVSLGGDVSVAGSAPEGGWPVRITLDHTDPLEGPGPVVAIRSGGLATSSTGVRQWRRGERYLHHIIDPATSLPAESPWVLVSVAAGSCLDANIAACAALVMGDDAARWLSENRLPSRLVTPAGRVTLVGDWPAAPASIAGVM